MRYGKLGKRLGLLVFLLYIGFMSAIGFFVNQIHARYVEQNKIDVEAHVVRIEKDSDGEDDCYYPVFSYVIEGKRFETRYNRSVGEKKYRIGDAVTIYCHKDNHGRIIGKSDDNWTFLFDVIMCIFILSMFVYPRFRKKLLPLLEHSIPQQI